MVTLYVPGTEPVVYGTVTASWPLEEPLLSASPEYVAVTVCVPAVAKDVWNFAVPWLKATGEPAATPSTLNCTVPVGVEVDPPVETVAVNESLAPFAGMVEAAVSDVNVEFGDDGLPDELPAPPPQLMTPRKITPVAKIDSVKARLLRLGNPSIITNAADKPPIPAVQPNPPRRFSAVGPEVTNWARVVVIASDVLPEPVTLAGENTHDD